MFAEAMTTLKYYESHNITLANVYNVPDGRLRRPAKSREKITKLLEQMHATVLKTKFFYMNILPMQL